MNDIIKEEDKNFIQQLNRSVLSPLYSEAAKLAGRPVEVIGTKDGKYVVEWFCFGESPPPVAGTEETALQGFIEKMKNRVDPLPKED